MHPSVYHESMLYACMHQCAMGYGMEEEGGSEGKVHGSVELVNSLFGC